MLIWWPDMINQVSDWQRTIEYVSLYFGMLDCETSILKSSLAKMISNKNVCNPCQHNDERSVCISKILVAYLLESLIFNALKSNHSIAYVREHFNLFVNPGLQHTFKLDVQVLLLTEKLNKFSWNIDLLNLTLVNNVGTR